MHQLQGVRCAARPPLPRRTPTPHGWPPRLLASLPRRVCKREGGRWGERGEEQREGTWKETAREEGEVKKLSALLAVTNIFLYFILFYFIYSQLLYDGSTVAPMPGDGGEQPTGHVHPLVKATHHHAEGQRVFSGAG